MAEGSNASFIPKNATRVRTPRASKRIYVFSYVSYVLFFGTLIAVIGTYLFSLQVERTRDSLQQQISGERTSFSESDIAAVRDLEKRLLLAQDILEETTAPSEILRALEGVIVDTARLVSFQYLHQDDVTRLIFSAATESFDYAVFQRDLIASVPRLSAADVTTFSYGEILDEEELFLIGESERLMFTFEGVLSPGAFKYEPRRREEALPVATNEEIVVSTTTAEAEVEPEEQVSEETQ